MDSISETSDLQYIQPRQYPLNPPSINTFRESLHQKLVMDGTSGDPIKTFLTRFNYPNIHGMDEVAYAGIFTTSNRPFLISWAFTAADPTYSKFIQDNNIKLLAELMSCHGFCSNQQSVKFMSGELAQDKQYAILSRMFHFLNNSSEEDLNKKRSNTTTFSMENLENLLSKDTNLFPTYGAKKCLTDNERCLKIKEYNEEINKLKEMIGERSSPSSSPQLDIDLNAKELKDALKKIVDTLPDFKRAAFEIKQASNSLEQADLIEFDATFPEMTQKLMENVNSILEFFNNMNLRENLAKNNTEGINNDLNESTRLLKDVSELCCKAFCE